jgi:hypothetical protein
MNYTWTFNGIDFTGHNPFKIIPTGPDKGKLFWKAIGMTEEEANQVSLEIKWHMIREERTKRLSETDWVSGEDVPQNIKDLWYPYRQALRDITNQSDPTNIIWPDKP